MQNFLTVKKFEEYKTVRETSMKFQNIEVPFKRSVLIVTDYFKVLDDGTVSPDVVARDELFYAPGAEFETFFHNFNSTNAVINEVNEKSSEVVVDKLPPVEDPTEEQIEQLTQE